ncbi:hypothetical protein N7508_011040 [Penicillium antarcticum]|uniref:uncharacterized protein n=1 Tax=Penicillium antarcticum TaxID=416450 RepID=UPI00238B9732|nr:uncharacterized protein N7508_011040 [Penicillium antarcticum]KAJ5288265.1 hypothetical protein N7508_011040 [Penicillium antarcticum]
MDANRPKASRPETMFFPTKADSGGNDSVSITPVERTKDVAAPTTHTKSNPTTLPKTKPPTKPLVKFRKRKRNSEISTSSLQTLSEDPWSVYIKGIEIFPRKGIFLAQNREDKMELVHIQQLKAEPASIQSLVKTVNDLSYRSFPRLLCHYQHEDHSFLVWEPVECSLSQVLGSKYVLSETEIASIVWPILIGIRYLRDCDRALATLTNDEVLFTGSGGVRIAGVERSCRIDPEDMNAATLKLTALSEIVKRLIKKNEKFDPDFPWSAEARNLPQRLDTVELDELMLVSRPDHMRRSKLSNQDGFFASLKGEAELKLMVNIVNKTSHYDINFPARS